MSPEDSEWWAGRIDEATKDRQIWAMCGYIGGCSNIIEEMKTPCLGTRPFCMSYTQSEQRGRPLEWPRQRYSKMQWIFLNTKHTSFVYADDDERGVDKI